MVEKQKYAELALILKGKGKGRTLLGLSKSKV